MVILFIVEILNCKKETPRSGNLFQPNGNALGLIRKISYNSRPVKGKLKKLWLYI